MSDLFDRARLALKIEDLADRLVKMSGGKDERRGHCPLCLAGEVSKSTPFKVTISKQTFVCFSCEKHGDVVDLYSAAYGMDGYQAAKEIAGSEFVASRETPKREPVQPSQSDLDREARRAALIADMWRSAEYFWNSPGHAYLVARGVSPAIVEMIDGGLRYQPAAPHHWDDKARAWATGPAMVAKVETTGGWPGGLHVTYLDPDKPAKSTTLSPAKRMWGAQGDQTPFGVKPGGAWLIGKDAPGGDLVVGEGIETTLSLASWLHKRGKRDLRVAAALSLNRLQGGVRRDAGGCMDIWRPMGDPDRRPFLWPACDTAITEAGFGVFVAIDRDMGPIRALGRTGRGAPIWFDLGAEARARLCARLASRAWRGQGWRFARPMWPRLGSDWGDMASEGKA